MSPKRQAQSLEGDLCYADLSLKQPRTSPGSSWKKGSSMSSSGKDHQEEVEYVTMVRLSWGCGDESLLLATSPPWKVNSIPMWTQLMRVGSEQSKRLQKCLHATSQPRGLGPNTGQGRARLSQWLRIP